MPGDSEGASPRVGLSSGPEPLGRHRIHVEPVREDYAISGDELDQLAASDESPAREVAFSSASFFLACGANVAVELTATAPRENAVIAYGALGLATLGLALCFGCYWLRFRRRRCELTARVRARQCYDAISLETIGSNREAAPSSALADDQRSEASSVTPAIDRRNPGRRWARKVRLNESGAGNVEVAPGGDRAEPEPAR